MGWVYSKISSIWGRGAQLLENYSLYTLAVATEPKLTSFIGILNLQTLNKRLKNYWLAVVYWLDNLASVTDALFYLLAYESKCTTIALAQQEANLQKYWVSTTTTNYNGQHECSIYLNVKFWFQAFLYGVKNSHRKSLPLRKYLYL